MSYCTACGAEHLKGPPITPGSNGSIICPYLNKDWHKLIQAHIEYQGPEVYKRYEGELRMICNYCGGTKGKVTINCASLVSPDKNHMWVEEVQVKEQAKRTQIEVRYDLLEASFLRAMAQVGNHGAKIFGDGNYKKSRMIGRDSPANHIQNHLASYILNEQYNHEEIGHERKYHLAAIAFNAMMEYFYEEHPELYENNK